MGVSRKFCAVGALDSVSFEADPGEIIGIIGQNGSGKSTLIRTIAGLLSPDSGTVAVFGDTRPVRSPDTRKKLGMLFDSQAHWENLSAWDNAFFFVRSYGIPEDEARRRLNSLFLLFALEARCTDPVSTLSYGMKRKLAVIEAISHAPDLILMDEPSIGLDFSSRMILHKKLREHARSGATVIFATNDVYEAQTLADRVLVCSDGKIVISGKPNDLIRDLNVFTPIELRLAFPVLPEVLSRVTGAKTVRILEDSPGRYRVRLLMTDSLSGKKGDPGPDGRDCGSSDVLARVVTATVSAGGILLGIECTLPNLGDVIAAYAGGGSHAS